MTYRKGIKQTPFSADHREILLHLRNISLKMLFHIIDIAFDRLVTSGHLCHHQIHMRIEYYVCIFVFPHKVFPRFQAECIVDDHIFVFRHIFAQPVICIQIELTDKFDGIRL